MKILRVIPSMDPRKGGPSEGIRQIQVVLQKDYKELEVDIVSMDEANSPWIENSSTKIFAVGSKKSTYSYSPALKIWLDENIEKYNLVIIHGIWQYHSLAAYNACKQHHIPYYVYTHGMLDPWFKEQFPLKHLKKMIYWMLFERNVINSSRGIIFTSAEERDTAKKSFPLHHAHGIVTSYGTAGSVYDKQHCEQIFYKKYPDLIDKEIILFVGRIHPKKGCDILIEAFSRIFGKGKDLHLFIAGPDNDTYAESLKQLAKKLGIDKSVTWAGMLQGENKWAAYNTASLFCLPSHQENFGIVVAEALSCSVPVVISNKVNIWREIVSDNAGFVGSDDIAGTELSLMSWVNLDASKKKEFSNNAKNCFLNRFDIVKAAADFNTIALGNDHGA